MTREEKAARFDSYLNVLADELLEWPDWVREGTGADRLIAGVKARHAINGNGDRASRGS